MNHDRCSVASHISRQTDQRNSWSGRRKRIGLNWRVVELHNAYCPVVKLETKGRENDALHIADELFAEFGEPVAAVAVAVKVTLPPVELNCTFWVDGVAAPT